MPDDFKYDVFLSHSAKGKAVVRPIAERLKKDALRVWLSDAPIKGPLRNSFTSTEFRRACCDGGHLMDCHPLQGENPHGSH
jgi:hypothetical protein